MSETYTPAFTITSLNAIELAIAEGALRVKYLDKEIEYRTLKDMLKIRDIMKRELGLKNCSPSRKGLFGGVRIKAQYDKDLC